jgi:hypothetical protein
MAYKFTLNPESLKRRFAVYVVVARARGDIKLYVGKTGDNRDGCNPVISRCGNHFSYNKVHSQVRNKIGDHEGREYTYIFDHFDEYHDDLEKRRKAIGSINEMERWLNHEVQEAIGNMKHCKLLNPLSARVCGPPVKGSKRSAFRTDEAWQKISWILAEMKREIGPTSGSS